MTPSLKTTERTPDLNISPSPLIVFPHRADIPGATTQITHGPFLPRKTLQAQPRAAARRGECQLGARVTTCGVLEMGTQGRGPEDWSVGFLGSSPHLSNGTTPSLSLTMFETAIPKRSHHPAPAHRGVCVLGERQQPLDHAPVGRGYSLLSLFTSTPPSPPRPARAQATGFHLSGSRRKARTSACWLRLESRGPR